MIPDMTPDRAHLDDAELALLARAGGAPQGRHPQVCRHCQDRLAEWQSIAGAAAAVERELVGTVAVPAFDALLGEALRGEALRGEGLGADRAVGFRSAASRPVVRKPAAISAAAAWRLVIALTGRQLRMMPVALLPAVALGLFGAVALALAVPTPALGLLFFTAVVPLLVIGSVLAGCRTRDDPRAELLSALPIGPSLVFGLRLTAVLAVDLALALSASVLFAALGHSAGVAEVVAGWFGQALLASAVGVVCAVWRSPAVGVSAALGLWLLGEVVGPLAAAVPLWLRAGIAEVWATTPWTVAAAVLVYGVGVAGMRFPRTGGAPA